jgi:hypothetical protein
MNNINIYFNLIFFCFQFSEFNIETTFHSADVSKPEQIQEMVQHVQKVTEKKKKRQKL